MKNADKKLSTVTSQSWKTIRDGRWLRGALLQIWRCETCPIWCAPLAGTRWPKGKQLTVGVPDTDVVAGATQNATCGECANLSAWPVSTASSHKPI
jgi:hypothetical protein